MMPRRGRETNILRERGRGTEGGLHKKGEREHGVKRRKGRQVEL